MEYVLDIPAALDDALRARARAEGKTVDQVALEALQLRAEGSPVKFRDLSFFGSMSEENASAIAEAKAFLDQCSTMAQESE